MKVISNQMITKLLERMPTDQQIRISRDPMGPWWRVEIRQGPRKCVQWFLRDGATWKAFQTVPSANIRKLKKEIHRNPFE